VEQHVEKKLNGADVGEDWPVARINAERYLALLAGVALGGWRIPAVYARHSVHKCEDPS
jgi:hypothetical protein